MAIPEQLAREIKLAAEAGSQALWVSPDRVLLLEAYQEDGEYRLTAREVTAADIDRDAPDLAEASIGYLAYLLRTTR